MPKDEFDFDDPLELNGVALYTDEDTSRDMAECFVEEFVMLGHGPLELLALFRNPHYLGLNMVWQNKGETFVREVIAETFARWGRPVRWPDNGPPAIPDAPGSPPDSAAVHPADPSSPSTLPSAPSATPHDNGATPQLTDPFGQPLPDLNL